IGVNDAILCHDLLRLTPRLGLEINRAYLYSVAPDADGDYIADLVEFVNVPPAPKNAQCDAGYLLGSLPSYVDSPAEIAAQIVEYGIDPVAARIRMDPQGPGKDWMHFLRVDSVGS